jgi:hypothetical protein
MYPDSWLNKNYWLNSVSTSKRLSGELKLYEYLMRRLAELADSVLKPIWDWVMSRSWLVRAGILVAALAIFTIAYDPTPAREIYEQSVHTARAALTDPRRVAIAPETKVELVDTGDRLLDTVKSDLLTLNGGSLTPWSTAQALIAAVQNEHLPGSTPEAVSFITSNQMNGCFCWAEIPADQSTGVCTFIAGWVMFAFGNVGESVSASDLTYLLGKQNPAGWWPMFQDKTDQQFASTYSTAWNMLGLEELRSRGLISAALLPAVSDAIAKSVSWLLTTRTPAGRWKPYPSMPNVLESDSISGLVMHALNVVHPTDLTPLNRAWLSSLPSLPPEASASESYYIEMLGSGVERIDHFIQLKLPWMLIATVDAYPAGNFLQRGRALSWLDAAVTSKSVATADANTNNWWRAELLYALNYLQNHT